MMGAPVTQVVDHTNFTSELVKAGNKDIRLASASGRCLCADQIFTNQRPESRGVGFGEQVGPEIEAEFSDNPPRRWGLLSSCAGTAFCFFNGSLGRFFEGDGRVGVPPGSVARSDGGVYAVS